MLPLLATYCIPDTQGIYDYSETPDVNRLIPSSFELSIKTKHVLQGFAKAAKDAGVKVQLHQAGSMFGVFFNENDVYDYATSESSDQEAFGVWFMSMLEQGIYLAPSQFETLFMSGAHSDDDIVITIDAAEVAMKKLAEFLNNK